ncbi:MAG: hypothetical protein K2I70_04910, partial [Bacilli bacterium]|nr:hypothetical protein [Bacilli bacterium]
MEIKILSGKVKKVYEEEVGYKATFTDIYEKEELGFELEVIYGSHVDTFLKYLHNGYVKLAILDGRIIALVDKDDRIELVRDVILPEFSGREKDGNINYIREKYDVSVDVLEAKLEDLVKTSHLEIVPMTITEDSKAFKDGINLELMDEAKNGTNIYCPSGSIQSGFALRMAGLETEDYGTALEKLVGMEVYLVECSLDVIAVVNKETKEICVINTFYGREIEHYNTRNVKMLEEKYGIAPSSI